jgi:predicted RecB family nuclease
MSAGSPKPLLDAHAARRCARRTHNDFDATIPKVPWQPSPALQGILDAGLDYEAEIFDKLRRIHAADLIDLTAIEAKAPRIQATLEAMDSGAAVIIGAQLPDDLLAQRTGRPDVLLKDPDSGPHHRYWPVDVKHHMHATAAKRPNAWAAPLDRPTQREQVNFSASPASTRGDAFQLAHYVRMLQACDRMAAGGNWAAIIGTRQIYSDQPALVWHDLDNECENTFSRSQGTKQRSVMERYDHEHAFRAQVANVARQRRGGPDDPEPVVRPIGQSECAKCPYLDWCSNEGSDLASWALSGGRLSVREWLALSRLGYRTTREIAGLEPDEDFLRQYLPEVSHVSDADKRLHDAIRRCRLLSQDLQLAPLRPGPVVAPHHDIEIDLDCEWDSNEFVYLWGARIRESNKAEYVSFHSFEEPDPGLNIRLANELVTWLQTQVDRAEEDGKTLAIYHWAPPEPRKLQSILGADQVNDLITNHFIDLLTWSRANLFSVHGHGLKVIAPLTGFRWGEEDADGLNSQEYVQTARTDGPDAEAARRWLLSYNEDDVAAMAHVRDHIAATLNGEFFKH